TDLDVGDRAAPIVGLGGELILGVACGPAVVREQAAKGAASLGGLVRTGHSPYPSLGYHDVSTDLGGGCWSGVTETEMPRPPKNCANRSTGRVARRVPGVCPEGLRKSMVALQGSWPTRRTRWPPLPGGGRSGGRISLWTEAITSRPRSSSPRSWSMLRRGWTVLARLCS